MASHLPRYIAFIGLYSFEYRLVLCDLVLCWKTLNGIHDTDIALVFIVADDSRTRSHSTKLIKTTIFSVLRFNYFQL